MLHLKHLGGRGVDKKATGWDGKILEELEGPRGGLAWLARHLLFRQGQKLRFAKSAAAGGRIVPI